MQSFKSFAVDINHALQSNLLSFDETEELISALAVIQARLNSHRNSLAPINKLPSELLARIFEFVIAPEPIQDLGEYPLSAPPRQATWNGKLVFVCNRWCTIVMECQRMWYYIVDDDSSSVMRYSPRAILQQSGSSVPLHLYLYVVPTPQPPTDSVSRWVIKNQPLRVEALYVHLSDKASIEVMLKSLATPLPSLRLLSVDGTWEYRRLLAPGMPTILGGGALNLKALVWSLSIPFIPGNAFPNLTDLNLNNLGGNVLNLDRLLQLLANCPRLETLILSQSLFDIKRGITRDRGPVKLDNLRAVWIRSMTVNEALTVLAYLQLPKGAAVRLSNLPQYEYRSELVQPPTIPVPFLQEIDDLAGLDVISNRVERRRGAHLHFIAVGTRSRFWIHVDTAFLDVRAYVRYLYGMLPKNNLRTLRFSTQETADVAFVRDMMLESLPSLDTLLVQQTSAVYPMEASSSIAAVSRALCPGGAPGSDASEAQSDIDSDEALSDGDSEGRSDRHSHDGSDNASHSGHPLDTTEQSTNRRRNHATPTDFPIDLAGPVPAPQLKVVGLKVPCASTASLRPFVRVAEARKKCGSALDTVLCSFKDVEGKDVDKLKEHVVEGVRDVCDKLWLPTVDEGWRVKNDYWKLYPEPKGQYPDEYEEWGLSMMHW